MISLAASYFFLLPSVITILNIVLTSCSKDWLNEKSNKNLVIPSTLKDFQAILDNNGVMNNNQVALGEVGSDGYECREDYIQYFNANLLNAYTWTHDLPYTDLFDWAGTNESVHRGPYRIIYYCNIVLDGLRNVSIFNDNDRNLVNNIMGQALFQRARCFFDLAQVFAPPFTINSNSSKLGIPLRLSSDITLKTTRSSLKETYEQIIADLKTAVPLLPNTAEYTLRGSKSAAYGMLSRIYLSIEDYENSLKYSDSCLKISNKLLNFNLLNKNRAYPFTRFNDEVIFHSTLINHVPIANAYILPELYNLYDSSDLRKLMYFRRNANGSISFRGSYYGSAILFGGLATDEVYLNRAESYARTGDVAHAMEDLNALLRTRWDSNVGYSDLTASNVENALRIILRERKKELFFRGVRWSDLRRLNQDSRFAVTITREVNEEIYTLEPNSYKYTFPIPDDIIQQTGIPQNEGWEK